MILIEDVKTPPPPSADPSSPSRLEAQPGRSSRARVDTEPLLGHAARSTTSYLFGSGRRPASVRSLSPPPEYTPPPPAGEETSTKAGRSARGRFLRALVAAVALYLVAALVLGLVLKDAGGLSDLPEEENAPAVPSPTSGPIARPKPDFPKPPHGPKQPLNRWDSAYYLPPLEHGHIVGCAPVSPSMTVVYSLALPMPTLALRVGTVRPRRLGRPLDEVEADMPTEPEVDVRVLPWLEDDDGARWGPWSEGEVKVIVETAGGKDASRAAGLLLQVCQLGDTLQSAVGIYSASSTPAHLVVTILVPMSEYTDRFISSLVVDGVLGSLFVGDMLMTKDLELPAFGREPGWSALSVRMLRGEVLIKGLDVDDFSIIGQDQTDIMVGAMRVSRSLEVSTGSEGGGRVVFGSLLIEPDCVCRIDSQSGAVVANVSLVSSHMPPLPASALFNGQLPGLPSNGGRPKPGFPTQPKLPILHPVRFTATSVLGNVTLRVLDHLPHIPLQASLRSAGSIDVRLTPNFQGYFSLTSPHRGLVRTLFPSSSGSGASTIPDPFGLSRKLVVHLARFGKGVVEASLGWGWAGKPDLEGRITASSEQGAVSVEMLTA